MSENDGKSWGSRLTRADEILDDYVDESVILEQDPFFAACEYRLAYQALQKKFAEAEQKLKAAESERDSLAFQLENSPTEASRWREKYYNKVDELNAAEDECDRLRKIEKVSDEKILRWKKRSDINFEHAKRLAAALEKIKEDSSEYHIAGNEYFDEFRPYEIADSALEAYKKEFDK